MKLPAKVIAAIVVVVALAGLGLWAQRASSAVTPVKLTAHDMDLIFHEMVSPDKQQEIASSPDEKQRFSNEIKEALALAQQAESEGYTDQMKLRLAYVEDQVLAGAYKKKHPDAKVGDNEIKAFNQANPNIVENLLKESGRQPNEIPEAQREAIKKGVAQTRVLADRARNEGLERDEVVKLQLMLARSFAMSETYKEELQKKLSKQATSADIDQYYRAHHSDFEAAMVRHIQVSEDQGLTEEQARQKAEEALARARNGEDFAKLVDEYSDPSAKENGGEWPSYIVKGMPVERGMEEFHELALSLDVGKVGGVVKSNYGFHVIKVESREPIAPPSDPRVRDAIKEKLRDESYRERINQIIASSRVEIAENFDATPKPAEQSAPRGNQ